MNKQLFLFLDLKYRFADHPVRFLRYGPLPVPRHVRMILAIYDLSGKKIRTLVNEKQASGSYQILWDGRNDAGQLVASGLYV